MNWYKLSQFNVRDFGDRNIMHDKIHFLEDVREYMQKLAKLVFQNGVLARAINSQIWNHKKISSHPQIRNILIDADKIALDSPWKFAALCKVTQQEINILIDKWKSELEVFNNEKLPAKMKGFVEDE
tara:strand:- start:40 stop:420 length:381 start_codon:yes stop_codon:yes gene_type:complete